MRVKPFLLSLVLSFVTSTSFAGVFRASVVETDITPTTPQWLLGYGARQSTGIHDHIYQRIAALDDGKATIYFISTEIAVMSPGYYDKVAQQVEKELGIKPQNLWWTVTHTHSAPEVGPPGVPQIFMPERYKQASSAGESNPEYSRFIEAKLMEGLKQVKQTLQPARLGLGLGFSTANMN